MVSFSLVPFHMILILLVNRSISRKDIILHGCSNAYTQNKQLYYRCHTLLKFGKIKVCLDIFDCPLREVNNHKKRETTFLFTSLQVTSEQSLVILGSECQRQSRGPPLTSFFYLRITKSPVGPR